MSSPAPPPNSGRFSVGGIALSITFLLVGIVLASVYCIQEEKGRLQNKEFLQKQLAHLTEQDKAPTPPNRQRLFVRVAEARSGEIPPIRKFQGRLLEVKKTTISSEVSGLVLEMPIEVGSFVKADETLIARIDDTWSQFLFETSDREIALKTTQLAYEKEELARQERLIQARSISDSEFRLQVNKVDQLKEQIEIAKLVHQEAGEKLKRTRIFAPFNGHVISKTTEIGSLLSPGTPLVQIISSGEIDAVIHVIQNVVDQLVIGQEINVDVHPIGLVVPGRVHSIVPHVPAVGPRMFPVHIRMSNDEGRLKSGMAVLAQVPESKPIPGIIVPSDAVMDKPDGRTVWVAITENDTTTVQPVPVKLLAHAIDHCSVEPETEDGKQLLVDKAQVIVDGAERLTPGQTVAIRDIDPKYFENLPQGSGHSVVREPQQSK